MSNAAGAIGKGFRSGIINNLFRGTCWFRCKKNANKSLLSVFNKKKSALLASLYKLQISQTPDIFKAASDLFVSNFLQDEDPCV